MNPASIQSWMIIGLLLLAVVGLLFVCAWLQSQIDALKADLISKSIHIRCMQSRLRGVI
jgi:hypothetical protein